MRFGFIVHPLEKEHIIRRFPLARWLPMVFVEAIMLFKRPKIVSDLAVVYSTQQQNGRPLAVDGLFVGVALTPRMFKHLPTWLLNSKIGSGLRLLERYGSRVNGLGALTACVGDAGVTLNKRRRVPVTTGNSYTVEKAMEAALELADELFSHLAPAERSLAVVGATGVIGQACLESLRDQFGQLILVGRDYHRLQQVAERLDLDRDKAVMTTDPFLLRRAHVVITVTSADTAIVFPEHLAPGTLVVDVARPRDVSMLVQLERPDDVLVIEGGIVALPEPSSLGFDFGFPPGLAYACMAETILCALEGMESGGDYRAFTIGKDVAACQVKEIAELGRRHGLKLAGYRSFETVVTSGRIDRFRAYASQRQRCVSFPNEVEY